MSLFPFAILCAIGLVLTAVFGAMHWVMAVEEGLIWGALALIPVVALTFTFQFWRRRWVRHSFWGGVISFTLAIAGFIGVIVKMPGLTEQFQAYRRGDYTAFNQDSSTGFSGLLKGRRDATPSYDHFSDGTIYAELAVELTATARNRSDWEQVETHWAYAADMMAAVSEEHPKYQLAQAKVKEYKKNQFAITRQYLR